MKALPHTAIPRSIGVPLFFKDESNPTFVSKKGNVAKIWNILSFKFLKTDICYDAKLHLQEQKNTP